MRLNRQHVPGGRAFCGTAAPTGQIGVQLPVLSMAGSGSATAADGAAPMEISAEDMRNSPSLWAESRTRIFWEQYPFEHWCLTDSDGGGPMFCDCLFFFGCRPAQDHAEATMHGCI